MQPTRRLTILTRRNPAAEQANSVTLTLTQPSSAASDKVQIGCGPTCNKQVSEAWRNLHQCVGAWSQWHSYDSRSPGLLLCGKLLGSSNIDFLLQICRFGKEGAPERIWLSQAPAQLQMRRITNGWMSQTGILLRSTAAGLMLKALCIAQVSFLKDAKTSLEGSPQCKSWMQMQLHPCKPILAARIIAQLLGNSCVSFPTNLFFKSLMLQSLHNFTQMCCPAEVPQSPMPDADPRPDCVDASIVEIVESIDPEPIDSEPEFYSKKPSQKPYRYGKFSVYAMKTCEVNRQMQIKTLKVLRDKM